MSSPSPKPGPGEPPLGTPTAPAVPAPPLVGQVPGAAPQMWHQSPGPPPAHDARLAWGFHAFAPCLPAKPLPLRAAACLSVCLQVPGFPPAPGMAWPSFSPPHSHLHPPVWHPCECSIEAGPPRMNLGQVRREAQSRPSC